MRAAILPILLMAAACHEAPKPAADDAGADSGNIARAEAAGRDAAEKAPGFEMDKLVGTWTVTAVAVGDGVQALTRDDPAYMGRIMAVEAGSIGWTQPDAKDATLSDECGGPTLVPLTGDARGEALRDYATHLSALRIADPDPYRVDCHGGNWGPEAGGAVLFPVAGGDLAMSWYDDGMLLLRKR